MVEIHLILNGKVDAHWLGQKLRNASDIYCCDGAYNKVKGLGVKGIIGDLDSLQGTPSGAQIIETANQDLTDFEKAILYLKGKCKKINVYGAGGGEMDHFLGNLSVGLKYKGEVELTFHDPTQHYFFAQKETQLTAVLGRIVSIVPFPTLEGVTYRGLQFPLKNATMQLGALIGIRNKATSDNVVISYMKGNAIVFVENR